MRGAPILLVEDNADSREAAAMLLRTCGYSVETACNGWDALTKLQAGLRPCVILLDIMMPLMNGYEFRAQQLADPAIAEIPLIAWSAIADRSDSSRLQANAYLSKSADAAELVSSLQRFCLP